jgi:hypothetical protein
MRVLLTRKLADLIDGVDLTSRNIGDVFDISGTEGRLLIAEKWAIKDRRSDDRPGQWPPHGGSTMTESRHASSVPDAAAVVDTACDIQRSGAPRPPRPDDERGRKQHRRTGARRERS